MQILGVARTLPFHSIGGMQAIAWDLFMEFARLGHTVTVLTTAIPGKPKPFMVDGVFVVPLPGSTPERSNAHWWKASAQWFIDNAAAKVDGVLSISAAGASIAAQRRHAPQARFIFQAHGTSWGEIVSKWRTRRPIQIAKSVKNIYWLFKDIFVYKRFDCIALVNEIVQTQYKKSPLYWTLSGLKTAAISNGVDLKIFKPDLVQKKLQRDQLDWSSSNRVVVFAARFHPQKGGEIAIRAFALLNTIRDDLRLLMIGDGEDSPRLKILSQELGCGGNTHFLGSVSREQMAKSLCAGDVFIFPTLRQEGLTMNVMEALAVGLYPVCSIETRQQKSASLPISYIDPENIEEVAQGLENALKKSSSETGLLTEEYSLHSCAMQYLRLLDPTADV